MRLNVPNTRLPLRRAMAEPRSTSEDEGPREYQSSPSPLKLEGRWEWIALHGLDY